LRIAFIFAKKGIVTAINVCPMKSRKRIWSEERVDTARGNRRGWRHAVVAAVRLKRGMISCRIQARKMGVPFVHLKVGRKNILAKCAAAENDASG